MKRYGFTLIELLIVVAIIAILAAIAVPNFLEAQTRAKISRCKADMRTFSTALETYHVDTNKYPPIIAPNAPVLGGPSPGSGINGASCFIGGEFGVSSRFIRLTTPISYISTVFKDPFIPQGGKALSPPPSNAIIAGYDTYDYADAVNINYLRADARWASICSGAGYHIVGCGPDKRNCYGGGSTTYAPAVKENGVDYDSTNGTLSSGDIVRIASSPGKLVTIQPAINRITNVYNF